MTNGVELHTVPRMEPKEFRAVLFDDYGAMQSTKDPYLLQLERGVECAGWSALSYVDPLRALRAMNDQTDALITGLGIQRRLTRREEVEQSYGLATEMKANNEMTRGNDRFPGERLIAEAHTLHLPVAVISTHPKAEALIRPQRGDVCIPRDPIAELQDRVTNWLGWLESTGFVSH